MTIAAIVIIGLVSAEGEAQERHNKQNQSGSEQWHRIAIGKTSGNEIADNGCPAVNGEQQRNCPGREAIKANLPISSCES
ncbi:hypothetical protein [Paenibacillus sp. FSL H7-0331]|uniref:hypothetical protein n=1 Tax=Paenibacillus sp. FSL H7-0331 TaxID=1920421 RepID=UPI00096E20B1|nr:hypothetical protein [Paenibacillus sp. FSL H7-0331]OMF07408.1 hypothetical protein BK127_29255 [Paenibacillus sp. FSL H7-0331]